MTDPHLTAELPEGFLRVPEGVWDIALDQVMIALSHPDAARRMADYYDSDGDYAGATFVEALPISHDDFTAADFAVLPLMGVAVESPRAVRRFLDPGPHHAELVAELAKVDWSDDLAMAQTDTLLAMAGLYEAVKRGLEGNKWVTASKLCARKRPRLFPVRDNVVQWWLGLVDYASYTVEWQIYAELVRTPTVYETLRDLVAQARSLGGRPDAYELRHLDVALWMHARELRPRR